MLNYFIAFIEGGAIGIASRYLVEFLAYTHLTLSKIADFPTFQKLGRAINKVVESFDYMSESYRRWQKESEEREIPDSGARLEFFRSKASDARHVQFVNHILQKFFRSTSFTADVDWKEFLGFKYEIISILLLPRSSPVNGKYFAPNVAATLTDILDVHFINRNYMPTQDFTAPQLEAEIANYPFGPYTQELPTWKTI